MILGAYCAIYSSVVLGSFLGRIPTKFLLKIINYYFWVIVVGVNIGVEDFIIFVDAFIFHCNSESVDNSYGKGAAVFCVAFHFKSKYILTLV